METCEQLLTVDHLFSVFAPLPAERHVAVDLVKAWWGGGGEMMDTQRDAPSSSRRDSRLFLQVRRVAA